VVVRVGSGATALNNSAAAVFLDEYDRITGALVQSVPMPTAVSGANRRLTLSGAATSEGALNLSSNGRFLTLAGYDANVGFTTVSTSTSGFINRIVARVDGAGQIDTTTVITDGYNTQSIRSAVTDDGTRFWTGGFGGTLNGVTTGGTRFVPLGSAGTSTRISDDPNNNRVVSIFGGQLYVTAGSSPHRGPNQVGTGLPTTPGQTTTRLPNASGNLEPYGMLLLDRNAVVPGFDAMYVADQSPAVGIVKYSFDGTNWASQGSTGSQLGDNRGATGLTGVISGTSVVLYATMSTSSTTSLERFVDTTAFNAPITGSFTPLATAGANTVFRGVAFAPVAPPPPPTATASATATIPAGPCLRYTVALDGAQETPPNNSPATGSANIVIDTGQNTLAYTIAYTGLVAPETAAHIHGFAPRGAPAGVLFPLPAGNPKAGVITYAEAQEANILAGLTYINIHSLTFPGGEIRGQIDGAPSICEVTPTVTATLTATATVTPTATVTVTPTATIATPTVTVTPTATIATPTVTLTPTVTVATATATGSPIVPTITTPPTVTRTTTAVPTVATATTTPTQRKVYMPFIVKN
jgi:hypothetical protein